MTNCGGCRHEPAKWFTYPCNGCYNHFPKPNWTPNNEISELIEVTELKAFEAGWKARHNKLFVASYEDEEFYESQLKEAIKLYKEESK